MKYTEIVRQKRITTVAGAWTFYFLTSLLPIVFLLITAFGVFGVEISADFISRLPEEFRLAGETILETAKNASRGITVFFILTVLFSGSALLSQMSKDGEFLYGVRLNKARGIMRRLWAMLALAALFVIFLAAAFLLSFRMPLAELFSKGRKNIFFTALVFLFAILLCYVIIVLLNKFISPVKQKFSSLALGGFVSLAADVAGTIGFIFYLKYFGSYNVFYGSLAAVIVFILWAYILMTGLVLGACVNVLVYERRERAARRQRAEKTPADAEGAAAGKAVQGAENRGEKDTGENTIKSPDKVAVAKGGAYALKRAKTSEKTALPGGESITGETAAKSAPAPVAAGFSPAGAERAADREKNAPRQEPFSGKPLLKEKEFSASSRRAGFQT